MVLYAYAIVVRPETSLVLPHGMQHPVQLIEVASLAVAVEPDIPLELDASNDPQIMQRQVQQVLTHDRVLQELFVQTTILPLRFGICFATIADLQAHLQAQALDYSQQLARFHHQAEYTLKLHRLPVEPIATESTSLKGRDYFLARKQQYQQQAVQQAQQNQELDQIHQVLVTWATDMRPGNSTSDQAIWHLLVPLEKAEGLYRQVLDWQTTLRHWTLEAIGPLPPHHFVTA